MRGNSLVERKLGNLVSVFTFTHPKSSCAWSIMTSTARHGHIHASSTALIHVKTMPRNATLHSTQQASKPLRTNLVTWFLHCQTPRNCCFQPQKRSKELPKNNSNGCLFKNPCWKTDWMFKPFKKHNVQKLFNQLVQKSIPPRSVVQVRNRLEVNLLWHQHQTRPTDLSGRPHQQEITKLQRQQHTGTTQTTGTCLRSLLRPKRIRVCFS